MGSNALAGDGKVDVGDCGNVMSALRRLEDDVVGDREGDALLTGLH